jgi:hypothetical protein
MPLSESQREQAFPVHIDLGKKMPEGVPIALERDSKGKKPKSKLYYPTLYVEGVKGLEQLPEEGCILVEFRRKRLSIEERDGEKTSGVELEIHSLCLPEDLPEIAADDLESVMKKAMDRDEEEDDEYEEEE